MTTRNLSGPNGLWSAIVLQATSMDWDSFKSHYDGLTKDVNVDADLFREVVLWALLEERIQTLVPPRDQLKIMIKSSDGSAQSRESVEDITERDCQYPW